MWWSPPTPESPYSLLSDEEEREEEEQEEEVWLLEEVGFSALPDKAKKRFHKEAEKKDDTCDCGEAHGDLPPQSPLYSYGASESSDEPYSDKEPGPSIVD